MGIESVGVSVTTAPAMSVSRIGASFTGESFGRFSGFSASKPPSLGGTRIPGFDKSAFLDTFPLPTPSSFSDGGNFSDISPFKNTLTLWQAPSTLSNPSEGGKAIPGVSPFENTKVLWQAPDQIKDIPLPGISKPSIYLGPNLTNYRAPDSVFKPQTRIDLKPESLGLERKTKTATPEINVGKLAVNEILAQPKREINNRVHSVQEMDQKALIRVREAIRAEEGLMADSQTEKEMDKNEMKLGKKRLAKTEQVGAKSQPKIKEKKQPEKPKPPEESYFEHDMKADETRKSEANKAIDSIVQKVSVGKLEKVTGQDIAENMPNPQPKEVKSEIAKDKDKDGSYENLLKQLETAGEIYSPAQAKDIFENLVNKNHAVRKTNNLKTQKATEEEVKKVLNGATVTFKS